MCVPLAPAPADTPWRWPREVSGQLEHCSPACAMQLSQLAILISCRFRGFYYYFIAGYYNDTLFHRSIKNFMIQVGCFLVRNSHGFDWFQMVVEGSRPPLSIKNFMIQASR